MHFAIVIGTEYINGTLRNLLARRPNRLRLLAGKLLTFSTLMTVAVVVTVGASFGAALILVPGHNISTAAWFTAIFFI